MKGDAVLQRGALAYYDSFGAGLVPCKVLAVRSRACVDVGVTAARRGYKRGETISGIHARHVVPRGAVCVRGGQYRIRPYAVKLDSEGATNGR